MSQPTPYTRQYNFNDYQTTNPNSPLPGAMVDAELNAVKLTSDQTRQNLGQIQRDDGKLANQSVHKDAFDRDALAMLGLDSFNPRGNWTTATVYAASDLVNYNNATYACLLGHTAAAAFPTDLNAGKWILIANAAIGDVSSAVDYFTGNGSTTGFTLTYTYTSNTGVQVYVNGVLQTPTAGAVTGDYSISGNTLTFVVAPPAPTVAGRKNVVVWGANVTVQANVQAAQTAASNAQGYATAAAGSATAAAGSASAASTSATNAASSATAAAGSASTAATQASNASTSASAAASSATAAAGSATTASTQATNAAASATTATTKASESAASATLANDWATKTSAPVAGGEYSAKYHATQAANSATSASNSASTATTQAGTATTKATEAYNSAANASASATSAASSATTATTQASTATTKATEASNSASAAATSATNAATSATNAAASATTASTGATTATTKATEAAASATSAATSASTATTQATTATTQATNASNSATSAAASAAAAAASYDSFDDRYLGAKASAPTLDNDGNALILGALYFNTTTNAMQVYGASGWTAAGSSVNGTSRRYRYIATAAQTTFSGADSNGFTLAYDAGYVDVFLNGVFLDKNDYTASSGTSIVLASAAAAGDELNIVAFGTFALADHYNKTDADGRFVRKDSDTGAAQLPAGTTAQRPATPVNGQIRYNSTTGFSEVYQGGAWQPLSLPYYLEYLVIAGGGSGGVYQSAYVSGNPGSNSSFGSITSVGGGAGTAYTGSTANRNGGSGGGGGSSGGDNNVGGSGTSGQGFAGGSGQYAGSVYQGGGGGGAGAVGGSASGTTAGSGGAGITSSITGSAVTRAGGGGGGVYGSGGTGGAGGAGGGGAGNGNGSISGVAGTINTGSGGGAGNTVGAGHGGGGAGGYRCSVSGENSGANSANEPQVLAIPGTAYTVTVGAGGAAVGSGTTSGQGGSGVVIIRYPGGQKGTGGTVTSAGGYTIHTFTSSGTFTA